jgi:RND family efflux transporter MFP subunit
MLGSDSVSRQEVDEKNGDFTAKQALVKAAQANVDRLVALKAFARIVAPFDGTVTARATDVGALINAGSGGGPELFAVSDTKKLRVYVNVPQNYVPSVPPGTKATMSVPEHTDKTYTATVESSAQSVSPVSGTTLMQLSVDNTAGDLMPGDYASVHLALAAKAKALTVPASALIFDAKGLSVATVGLDGRVVVKPVTIARDLGNVIEVGSGIAATDRVIQTPPDGISSGVQVHIAGATPTAAVAAAAPKDKDEAG